MSKGLKKKRQNRYLQSEQTTRPSGKNTENYRYTASDFEDNAPSASLWTGNGHDSFFEAGGVRKEKGDIITILVMNGLKIKIQGELAQYFSKKGGDEDSPTEAKDSNDQKDKVFDKISSIVSKEVRSNHIMIRGRKELIYEGVKRLIEVNALINRKDVSVEDTINSSKILQTNIRILR